MTVTARSLDQLSVDTIRTLAIDGVQRANSGHPGAPMGMAPMAYVLWTQGHAPRTDRADAGPIATASCSRPGTPRCSSTRCST